MADEPPDDSKPRTLRDERGDDRRRQGVAGHPLQVGPRQDAAAPKITSDGRGTRSLWPLEALERARFIVERRAEFHTMEEIKEMVLERWPPTAQAREARERD
jgi:hypothetical protein